MIDVCTLLCDIFRKMTLFSSTLVINFIYVMSSCLISFCYLELDIPLYMYSEKIEYLLHIIVYMGLLRYILHYIIIGINKSVMILKKFDIHFVISFWLYACLLR